MPSNAKIAFIVGWLRRDSLNRALAEYAVRALGERARWSTSTARTFP